MVAYTACAIYPVISEAASPIRPGILKVAYTTPDVPWYFEGGFPNIPEIPGYLEGGLPDIPGVPGYVGRADVPVYF